VSWQNAHCHQFHLIPLFLLRQNNLHITELKKKKFLALSELAWTRNVTFRNSAIRRTWCACNALCAKRRRLMIFAKFACFPSNVFNVSRHDPKYTYAHLWNVLHLRRRSKGLFFSFLLFFFFLKLNFECEIPCDEGT